MGYLIINPINPPKKVGNYLWGDESSKSTILGGETSTKIYLEFSHAKLGKWSNLTDIFQRGWVGSTTNEWFLLQKQENSN